MEDEHAKRHALVVARDDEDEKNLKRATGKNMIIYSCKALYPMRSGDGKYHESSDKFTAIALKYDRIVQCGTIEELTEMFPNATVDKSFEKNFIYPGFVDPHMHLWLLHSAVAGEIVAPDDWVLPWMSCPGQRNREDYIARCKEVIATRKKEAKEDPDFNQARVDKFIIWGWHHYWHGQFTKDQLDEIFGDTPVLLFMRSLHGVVFNTAFAKLFKEWTPENEFDFMRKKYKDNNAILYNDECWKTYMFQEDVFVRDAALFFPFLLDPRLMPAAMSNARDMLVSGGIVAMVDQGIQLAGPALDMFTKAEGKYSDPAKAKPYDYYVVPEGYTGWQRLQEGCFPLVDAVQPTGHPLESTPDGQLMYLPKQLKLFTDGAAMSQMMRVAGGYTNGSQGVNMMRPPDFQTVFKHFWDKGFQIHAHCNGDLGLQTFIDTIRYNMQRNPRADHRCAAHHLCVMNDKQPKQMKDLGMVPSFNTSYNYVLGEQYARNGMTKQMAHNMGAVGSCTSIGLKASFHSDAPVAPPSPLYLAQRAIDRKGMETGAVLGKENCVDRYTALKAITINAAYCCQLERDYGSLEPGKLASFAVLDEDYFAVPESEIEKIYVVGTLTGGDYNPNTISKENHVKNLSNMGAGSAENKRVTEAMLNGEGDDGKKVDCCEVNQQLQKAASDAARKDAASVAHNAEVTQNML